MIVHQLMYVAPGHPVIAHDKEGHVIEELPLEGDR
jgi:hypothetical protein